MVTGRDGDVHHSPDTFQSSDRMIGSAACSMPHRRLAGGRSKWALSSSSTGAGSRRIGIGDVCNAGGKRSSSCRRARYQLSRLRLCRPRRRSVRLCDVELARQIRLICAQSRHRPQQARQKLRWRNGTSSLRRSRRVPSGSPSSCERP